MRAVPDQSKPQQKKIDMETTTRSETSAGADKHSLNPDALNQLLGQMVNDLGAAVNGALVVLGDRLGIYTALAGYCPGDLATTCQKTKLHERQLREWLSAQAASGYLAMMRPAMLFFSRPNRSQCSLIQIAPRQ
jgi:hypothetical protein